ncbi:MAG: hypothetical protein QOE33_1687 [Acidobacteriota bacterium]|nr:hypothetical protein [Acidobacteriota bacterium]
MNIENEYNFRAALRDGINLFLGAGFSVLARDSEGKNLPLGGALTEEMCQAFSLPTNTGLDLGKACTIIESTRRDELRAFLKKRHTVSEFDLKYYVLDKLRVRTILTTNIDDLIFKVYGNSSRNYINDMDLTGPEYFDRRAINYAALHGSVVNDHRPYRFSVSDLASAFAADPDKWHVLSSRLKEYPTLFWGYSLNDAGTLQALSPETSKGRSHRDKWIVIHPDQLSDVTIDFFNALGFLIVESDTSEMLDYLADFANTIEEHESPISELETRALFPDESIPESGTVVVRSILEFFLGGAPQWSDIFSGQLHRTSYFGRITDSIHSGKHTVIIGMPACGKTTLMMQVAANFKVARHKLMTNSLTYEKAHLIGNQLDGKKALVFLDNFADSMAAFEFLTSTSNIQVVAADRDYQFGIVSHRISTERCNIIDVTDLSPADIQACLQSIPSSSKRLTSEGNVRTDDQVHRDTFKLQPSLFDIIERNLAGSTLKQRFRSVLSQLAKEDAVLRDLLLMISYVHKCRVPTSMDMLFAFLRNVSNDYSEINSMLKRLGSVVAEYGGRFEFPEKDLDQDYYVPRSTLVGEAVVSSASGPELKRVLTDFHNNISPYRIPRYDIFRRYAYDYLLIARAFPKAGDGKEFYENLYARADESPYMLQQCALYLAKKKRYTEAFEMIDRATVTSGGRIWSIKNSHAVILFKANIEHAFKPGARETLRQSMRILTECFRWDKRKPYHALVFAEQSLQYWEVYSDGDAIDYLTTARQWLVDEQKRSPWQTRIKYLLPDITRALESAAYN